MGDAITSPSSARRILALACGALALFALASCSKISQSTVAPNAGHSIPGTLRYADIEEPISFNPLLRTIAVATDMDMFIFGFFYNFDDKMRFVPELATVVPTLENGGISKDGLTITYHLRRGVKWHDGAPFTSHDVVFTVHAILNPDNNLSLRTGWDQIGSVEALDDHTVRFHLKRIYAPAISTYFAEGGLYPVLPAHLLEKYPNINQVPFNSDPIGTGPFKFVKWVHGDRVELAANPDYWRGPPKLKRIIYKVIPNDVTILNQLRTHEIDAWFRAAVSLYPQIRAAPKGRLPRRARAVTGLLAPRPQPEEPDLPRPARPPSDGARDRPGQDLAQHHLRRACRRVCGSATVLVGIRAGRRALRLRSRQGAPAA